MNSYYTIFQKLITLSLTLLIISISPSSQQQISTVDLNALQQLTYTLTDLKKSNGFFSSWDFTSPENICTSFAGVTCSVVNGETRVTSLFLGTGLSDSPGLAGTISDTAIYQLTELTQFILYPGIVTGFIPESIGFRLPNLRVLSLTNNRLTGSIPESITELKKLHTLDLSHNRLTGVIPAILTSSLLELRVLVLSFNNLAGEIPEFSDESRLIHLDLRSNLLSGTLPETTPFTLRYLSLSSNGLWGPIENLIKSSSYLVYLDLSMNKFSGPIPDSLFRCSFLSSMYLQRNNFSGELRLSSPLPAVFLGPGSTVDLSHNFLSGEIPEFLSGVETLFLNNNRFAGKVPESYVGNVIAGKMRTLYLQHNYLAGFPMKESVVPDGVALCLSYNCMVPPAVGLTACPASAGGPVSRPVRQCSVFSNG
uniref:receptor protein-tyrosine kinase CEPR1-like n=1 Tax=Erigeron canadensis TaxID=72917 RepID=UPI001CB8C935|nr:receptor protein-tyrosine kinase CEPR1-like [Erigeron canadensis]